MRYLGIIEVNIRKIFKKGKLKITLMFKKIAISTIQTKIQHYLDVVFS